MTETDLYFRFRCEKGFKARGCPESYKERLKHEMDVIIRTGFSGYFCIVWDIHRWCRENNILYGVGRGSVAGSLCSYCLFISALDPIKYNLPFERFMNETRISSGAGLPDIDLDFDASRRDEVIQYVMDKYGHDNVCRIGTYGSLKAKAAIRDTARVLGYAYQIGDKLAKLALPPIEGKPQTLETSYKMVDQLKEIYEQPGSDEYKILHWAQRIENRLRSFGTHAGGIIISDTPVAEKIPLHPGKDKEPTTQFEMVNVEEVGLIKFDFLALTALTINAKCLEFIKQRHRKTIDIFSIPVDDPLVYDHLCNGDVLGIFQMTGCLAGDSLISKETIRHFHYNKQKPKCLSSVSLCNGKTKRNQILNTVESGVRSVYTLVANNRFIKATKDHQFLTYQGWKPLEEITTEDFVLIKTKSTYRQYRTCLNCKKPINGRKSTRCYQCSATFHSNPSKHISRRKISLGRRRFFKEGGTVWMKGRTKDTCPLFAQAVEKGRKTQINRAQQGLSHWQLNPHPNKGKTLQEIVGAAKAREIKAKASARNSGENNPMFGKPCPNTKRGYRSDLGHYVRSSWEADFARILNLQNIEYEYEKYRFTLDDNGKQITYCPGFWVPNHNCFYEIKGFMRPLCKKKIDLFKKQYPEKHLVVIQQQEFAELALKYKNLIRWECPKIPPGFEWARVEKVEFFGREMTYDISMAAPLNNFIASSFVVHNSEGIKDLLVRYKPKNLEDISAIGALFRPGPLRSGLVDMVVNVRNGSCETDYLHQNLIPILKDTSGIILYQEQTIEIFRTVAGFSSDQADIARRCVTGNTFFWTEEHGFQTIEDLYNLDCQNITTLNLHNFKHNKRKIRRFSKGKIRPVCKVTTQSQTQLTCTYDHPIFTNYGWLTPEEIQQKENCFVLHLRKEQYGSISKNKDQLYLVASLITEGYTPKSGNWTFVNSNKKYLNLFIQVHKRLGGTDPKNIYFDGDKSYSLHLTDKVKLEAQALGVLPVLANQKELPSWVINLNQDCLLSVLGWMIDFGGEINSSLQGYLEYCSKSKKLCQQVKQLIENCGFRAFHYKKWNQEYQCNYYYTRVADKHDLIPLCIKLQNYSIKAQSFIENFDFETSANNVENKFSSHIVPEEIWRPIIRGLIDNSGYSRQELIKSHINGSWFSRLDITIDRLKRILAICGRSKPLEFYTKGETYWDKVLNIKPAGEQQTYDFTMSSQTSPWGYANGILIHNSIGKKKEELLLGLKKDFINGVLKQGYSQDFADKLFEQISGMSAYQFNRAHSASYGYLGYIQAWLKAYYPLEYLCACLQTDYDDRDKVLQYIAYCKEKGIKILPPDINEPVLEFGITGEALRFGLAGIKNVGKGVAQSIINCRIEGKFNSIQDFINRITNSGVNINRRQLQSIVLCGACDSLGQTRKALIAGIEETYRYKDDYNKYIKALERYTTEQEKYEQRLKDIENYNLLSKEDKKKQKKPGKLKQKVKPEPPNQAEYLNLKEFSHKEVLDNERELLGFYISGHPIDLITNPPHKTTTIIQIKELAKQKQRVRLLAMIQSKKESTAKKTQKKYANLVLEDKTATIECVLFSKPFQSYSYLLDDITQPFLIEGRTDITETDESKIVRLHVDNLVRIPLNLIESKETSFLSFNSSSLKEVMEELSKTNSTCFLGENVIKLSNLEVKDWRNKLIQAKKEINYQ